MSARETICPLLSAATQPAAMPTANPTVRRARPGLITDWHLGLLAIVYVRQSSPQQIRDHRESRERQYALVNYAIALGWPRDRILIIDDDQGLSGKTAENRERISPHPRRSYHGTRRFDPRDRDESVGPLQRGLASFITDVFYLRNGPGG